MEFILARLQEPLPDHEISALLEACRLSTVDGPLLRKRWGTLFLAASPRPLPSDNGRILFDGHAVMGGKAMSAAVPETICPAAVKDYMQEIRFGAGAQHVSGVFAALSLPQPGDEGGSLELFLDPLSQYSVFHLDTEPVTAVSNNIYFLEALARHAGTPLTRRMTIAGQEGLIGHGRPAETGFEEVRLMPPAHRLFVTTKYARFVFKPVGNLSSIQGDREEILEWSVSGLAQGIEALHRDFAGDDIVYDVTGGIDSRLCLAASRAAGLRGQLYFRSGGGPQHDTAIPDMIAHRFGLSYAGFPENFDGEDLSLETLAKRAVFRAQGQSSLYNFELGAGRVAGVCRVRGGMGEVVRTFYRGKFSKSARWKRRDFIRSLMAGDRAGVAYGVSQLFGRRADDRLRLMALMLSRRWGDKGGYFTRGFRAQAAGDLRNEFTALREARVPEDALLDGLYLTSRSRRHFGYTSQMLNQVRPSFEPLSDIALWELACNYTPEERARGQVVYDLMRRLDPDLLAMPVVSSLVRDGGPPFTRFEGGAGPGIPAMAEINSVPQAQISDAARAAGLTGHAAHILPHEALFFDLLMALPRGHNVWQMLDRAQFERLAADKERRDRLAHEPQLFMRLLYGLIWIHGLEDRTPLSRML